MRVPTYLSPSALAAWEKDPEAFYIARLAETRAPRLPQERPASVGSAFDACVKSALHAALFGEGHDPAYGYDALFVAQVEPQNRDWAKAEGEYVFDCYKMLGAFDTLLGLLQRSDEPPRFEFSVEAVIGGVPFLGKPDCRFVLAGQHIIHDWKINGYCSKNPTSPTKGYMYCRPDGVAHKKFVPLEKGGLVIDAGYLEDCSTDWADQLTLYGWALGEKVGDQEVVQSIHQGACKPIAGQRPSLRFAEYRARVRDSYQDLLLKRLQRAWKHISTGHVIPTLSVADCASRCALLEKEAASLHLEDGFFADVVRPKYRG
jgi:hypothetical protein